MERQNNQNDELSYSDEEREKVVRAFIKDGKLTQIPGKLKKKLIVFREILGNFEVDRDYTEKEVNEIIAPICEDYCTIRRYFVGVGWMTRQGGIYRRLDT